MRFGPLVVTFLTGALLVSFFFIPHHRAQHVQSVILDWANILYAFALALGTVSLWMGHQRRVAARAQGWLYNFITLAALAFVTGMGILQGVHEGTVVSAYYNTVNSHIVSTMFALLAFFIASAAFRAFRARNVEATLLLVTAVVMMIGRVSIGEFLWPGFPALTEWLLDVPNLAAKRAVALGIGLGAISTALKIILGIDRSYLGRS